MINGDLLVSWGIPRGPIFGRALRVAQDMEKAGRGEIEIYQQVLKLIPSEITLRTNSLPFANYLSNETEDEETNYNSVIAHMDNLLRLPTVEKAAVMPDACPAGQQPGTIPVGGVVATRDSIHPGFHSADICCSMFATVFERKGDLKRILDEAMNVTHFGPGGRKDHNMHSGLRQSFQKNPFLKDLVDIGDAHTATQGDGNHFLFVGTLRSSGQPCVVTHHGSRGVGAKLYQKGMAAAKRHTKKVANRIPEHQAWLDANSDEGIEYWNALQIIRDWTYNNHLVLHRNIQQRIGNSVSDQFWNEHNFVFHRMDGMYYHAKGATPSFKGYQKTLIPLNMSQPIMICSPTDGKDNLGFAPHGAGRNMSRKEHMRRVGDDSGRVFETETAGLDVRSFSGVPDISELPSAYKDGPKVRAAIEKYSLANIVDEVIPYGCIMAGEQRGWKK